MTLRTGAFLLAAGLTLLAADPWTKVRDLPSGTELRVYKTHAKQPLLVKFDQLTADSLVVVRKDEQMAIAKADIDRIDYRPTQKGSRVVRETNSTTDDPSVHPEAPNHPRNAAVPSQSTSSSVDFGSKPDFQTIYRRVGKP